MNKKELFAVTLAGFIVSNVLSKIIERRREEKYFSDSLESTLEQYRRWRELRDPESSKLHYEKKVFKEES